MLLIAAVLLLMPRGSPYGATSEFSRAQPFSRSHFEDGGKGGGGERYAIVIDAGSTGSRVHIFKFLVKGGALELQFDKFDQLKPGLSSYADDPPKAADSLAPLLKLAEETIPAAQQASTSIMVGATAGLRLLPDGKADIILEEVRGWLRKHPFKVGTRATGAGAAATSRAPHAGERAARSSSVALRSPSTAALAAAVPGQRRQDPERRG